MTALSIFRFDGADVRTVVIDGEPWFVADKNLEHNILYVVQGASHPALFSYGLLAVDVNWISGRPPISGTAPFSCTAKFRYRQADQAVTVTVLPDGPCLVRFQQPQKAVTPGQAVVFYDGDVCLGGGTIHHIYKEEPYVLAGYTRPLAEMDRLLASPATHNF